ncbi:MAG TPA: PPA1309 family protein [Mycobacteriales bacterium]|nr:PPA1309 family protein [Mycobacteriales bacterium]
MTAQTGPVLDPLHLVVGEVEQHVAEAGWDQPPLLFALVETEALLRAEPQVARTMGVVADRPGALTPVQQDALPDGPLDEVLARIEFGEDVLGAALAHEVLVLPPSAEAQLEPADDPARVAAGHPDRREVRMVVGVLRDGSRAAVLRLRGIGGEPDERVTGPDLAPGLAAALLATLGERGAAAARR